jgi:superfamily II DNA/RNA helicase
VPAEDGAARDRLFGQQERGRRHPGVPAAQGRRGRRDPRLEECAAFVFFSRACPAHAHAPPGQDERQYAIKAFKSGQKDVMVASSVASKGLDFNDIQHVIIFSMPKEIEDYVHQIGRTGRSGRTGLATTFVNMNTSEQTLLDLKYLLLEAGQKVPAFLQTIEDPRAAQGGALKGCPVCGGACASVSRRVVAPAPPVRLAASRVPFLRVDTEADARAQVSATASRRARSSRTRSGGRWPRTASGTTRAAGIERRWAVGRLGLEAVGFVLLLARAFVWGIAAFSLCPSTAVKTGEVSTIVVRSASSSSSIELQLNHNKKQNCSPAKGPARTRTWVSGTFKDIRIRCDNHYTTEP